jgi:hypothetical protein
MNAQLIREIAGLYPFKIYLIFFEEAFIFAFITLFLEMYKSNTNVIFNDRYLQKKTR